MGWRTVIISNRAKLDLKLGYLIVRAEETSQIFIDEISTLVIETTAVSITTALLSELVRNKVKIIFCDEYRNPCSELVPYYGCYDTSFKIRLQMKWDVNTKKVVWKEVVKEKILNQARVLKSLGLERYELLEEYASDVQPGDPTNREGHAAKVYFNDLFGNDFSRSKECNINKALNYGYTILLSAINREIAANGLITQIGIFHDNKFNQFNLACDLIEPLRYIVDLKVIEMNPTKFEWEEKQQLINLLNKDFRINNTKQTLSLALSIYCKSVFASLDTNNVNEIRFIEFNEL